jgi:uncharacterized protein (DUF433 family)
MGPYAIIDRGRGPELAGTRVTVFDVLHYLDAGHGPTYIAAVLGISTPAVQTLMQYIEEHKEEVRAENQKILDRIARGNPPEVEARLRESRAHGIIQARLAELRRKRLAEGTTGRAPGGGRSRADCLAARTPVRCNLSRPF